MAVIRSGAEAVCRVLFQTRSGVRGLERVCRASCHHCTHARAHSASFAPYFISNAAMVAWSSPNHQTGVMQRPRQDAIFILKRVSGDLTIGDKHEIDKATWRKPAVFDLPTSRYITDLLFPRR
jgi:hypothetical protein